MIGTIDNVDGEMVIVPEQAEIVKKIFADTLAGKSTHAIAGELNAKGVLTKKGGNWTPGTINGIIGNEKYTGDVLYQKTYTDSSFKRHTNYGELDQYLVQNHHAAIVSHEDFDRANAVLRQRGKEKGNGRNTKNIRTDAVFQEGLNALSAETVSNAEFITNRAVLCCMVLCHPSDR